MTDQLQLYNSLTGDVQPLKAAGDTVRMYLCGITPYDTTHLGHAFTASVADILIRHLLDQGRSVRYVQNVTDVDDDILRVARESGEDWRGLGNRWTRHYIQDMKDLNIRAPDRYARATAVISEIIARVQRLLERGVAYQANGSVYFEIDSWSEYGALSGLSREAMLPLANERGNNPEDPNKRNPLDFVLWQAASPGEPSWDSPWGLGRPGWHIECTTLIQHHLGPTIDLHLGGADLIYPHHESEIAQAEPLGQAPFVRHWTHIAMVEHEGQKMSKSLGNLVMVRDLLARWSPDALRLYLARQHYREPWGFDESALDRAQSDASRIAASLSRPAAQRAPESEGESTIPANSAASDARARSDSLRKLAQLRSNARSAFSHELSMDLNSPAAVKVLQEFADEVARRGGGAQEDQAAVRSMAGVLGLQLGEPDQVLLANWDRHLQEFLEH